jgi:hypothetical protein
MIASPFKYGKLVDKAHFVNRTAELKLLKHSFNSGINTILISPRRWGKSSLVKLAAAEFTSEHSDVRFCFIDMFNIRSKEEFYETFAREVLKVSYTKWEERMQKARGFFKHLIPKFTMGNDPSTDFSLTFDWYEVSKNPTEILNLPETIALAKGIKIVVCIDEFQNISFLKNHIDFQKKLRAHWQQHQIASYCLYGSKRHMMTELFEKKAMPFYKFGDVLFLKKINTKHWAVYIVKQFKSTAKEITVEQATYLAELVDNHSYFVQQLANMVWFLTETVCSKAIIKEALHDLMNQYDLMYQKDVDSLTNSQLNFLKAVVKGEKQFSSKATIDSYKLGTSANVARIKKALESKELIDVYRRGINFVDPLFKRWFEEYYVQ